MLDLTCAAVLPSPCRYVRIFPRDGLVERVNYVGRDIEVGILINRDAGRCVRHKCHTDAFLDSAFVYRFLKTLSNLYEFSMLARPNPKLSHNRILPLDPANHTRPASQHNPETKSWSVDCFALCI